MSESKTLLAKRLVAHPKWEWDVGMAGVLTKSTPSTWWFLVGNDRFVVEEAGPIPDIDHPATQGHLLRLLLRDSQGTYVIAPGYFWPSKVVPTQEQINAGESLGERIASELLKAWERS